MVVLHDVDSCYTSVFNIVQEKGYHVFLQQQFAQ